MVFGLFSEKLQKLIKEKGFIEPTLPQKLGIPEIMSGKDVLIIAPTGTGKTETTMLPVFDMVGRNELKPISVLYINPLRSLSRDLLDRLVWWANKLDLDISVRHGDVGAKERRIQREMPPHILITTPETLGAILPGKIMRNHLRNVKYVIIDEIHELVESKRGVQLSLLLERLAEIASFQRIGLSATVGSPELVADFFKLKKIVHAEHLKKYDIRVEAPKPTSEDKSIADELAIGEETTARLRRLYDIIKSHNSTLIFTNTRETAEVISSRLRSLDRELKQTVHHGSLSKEKRIKSEQEFKSQALKSLIATSSLELGIDIGSIDMVVQYLSPRQVTRLVQRVGRGGHRIGAVSEGIVISGGEDLFEAVAIANNAMRGKLEGMKVHSLATDVLAAQIVGVTMDEYEATDERIFGIIRRAYPYRDMEKKDFLDVLKFLGELRLLWLSPEKDGFVVRRRRRSWEYYFANLSTIPDIKQYKVISIIEQEPIGNLDDAFVAEHGVPGEKFVCSGRAWKIIQIDGPKVIVEPIEDIESAIPAWEGELIPVPYNIAQGVADLRKGVSEKRVKLERGWSDMEKLVNDQKEKHVLPGRDVFMIEDYKDFIIIHSCSGSLVNDTIGKYIAARLTQDTGVAVNIKIDPYRIMLQTVAKPDAVKNILMNADSVEDFLIREVERSSMFKYRFLHVAKRFGVISRSAQYDKINLNRLVKEYANTPVYKETLREIMLEKMDLEKAKDVLDKIKKGDIKLVFQHGLSVLGGNGLTQQFSEVMKPRMPEQEILTAFKRRLLATRMRMVCMNCAGYNIVLSVRSVDAQPECPKCHSRLIAVTRKSFVNAVKIVKKRLDKKGLNEEEQKDFQTLRRSSDLVIVYGSKAAEAMAARGVGPQTAARILSMLRVSKDKFYEDVLEAEKQFAKTKIYWK